MNKKMSVVIDDNKHHLTFKRPTTNFFTRNIRDNRVCLVNHIVTLTRCNLTLWNECEKHNDDTTAALKIIVHNLFSPSSNDLSLTFLEIRMDRIHWVLTNLIILVLAGAHVHSAAKSCS